MQLVSVNENVVTIELYREDCEHLAKACEVGAQELGAVVSHWPLLHYMVWAGFFRLAAKAAQGEEFKNLWEYRHSNHIAADAASR